MLAVASGTGVTARLTYNANTGYNSSALTMANWEGHALGGFIVRSSSAFITSTVIQLATPVLMRVGPEGTILQD